MTSRSSCCTIWYHNIILNDKRWTLKGLFPEWIITSGRRCEIRYTGDGYGRSEWTWNFCGDLPAKADQREKPMKAVACSDLGTTSWERVGKKVLPRYRNCQRNCGPRCVFLFHAYCWLNSWHFQCLGLPHPAYALSDSSLVSFELDDRTKAVKLTSSNCKLYVATGFVINMITLFQISGTEGAYSNYRYRKKGLGGICGRIQLRKSSPLCQSVVLS